MKAVLASPEIASCIERFQAAFAAGGLPLSEVRVTWNYDQPSCRLQVRLPEGTGFERHTRGRAEEPEKTVLRLVREMAGWVEKASARVQLGGPWADSSCRELPYPPEFPPIGTRPPAP